MFELLGLSLLLAGLLAFNSLASVAIAGLWRVAARFTDKWTAVARARFLFSLRTLPAIIAFLAVALLIVPSYLTFEPRQAPEPVSFKLGILAVLSAAGLAFSICRGVATRRATAKLTSAWLARGRRIQIKGIEIEAWRIDHAFPLIAIIGFLRPRLFIANQVLDLLTPEEISAAVAHENGHLVARDNLKRGLLQACRDTLLIIPSGRLLDRAWSEASEEAADESAARAGNNLALDLASALVKIARIVPAGARPTMPAGVFLLGDKETKGIRSRVSRLLALAATEYRPAFGRDVLARLCVWVPAGLLLTFLVVASSSTMLLSKVHAVIEHAVFTLR